MPGVTQNDFYLWRYFVMFGILKKKATDLTVGESLGLSLGIMVLSVLPFAIAAIVEGDYLGKKEEEQEEPPMEITAEDLEVSDE